MLSSKSGNASILPFQFNKPDFPDIKEPLHDVTHKFRDKRRLLELSIDIESPPCVIYGPATDSTGAIISGQLILTVKNPNKNWEDTLETYEALQAVTSRGSPKKRSRLSSTLSNTLTHLSLSPVTSFTPSNDNGLSSTRNVEHSINQIRTTSVSMSLIQKVQYHKPFLPDTQTAHTCSKCRTKVSELKTWKIQTQSKVIPFGKHSHPFSHLISGSLPSTSCLGSNAETQISYELIAAVTYSDPIDESQSNSPQNDQLIHLKMPVPITRSIPRTPDKNSLRVFPPTELTAAAVLPNVVYPKSTFPLEMKLDGVSMGDRRWRMRKLIWRIEETTRVKSHACRSHRDDLKQLEEAVKVKEQAEKNKKQIPIKRYGDIGPQIRVAVSSPENLPFQRVRGQRNSTTTPSDPSIPSNISAPEARNPVDEDRDDTDNNAEEFIHPSDDALRQEVQQQQQRLRERHLKEELKNNSSLFTEEVRIIARGEMKSGWKTDFDNNGKIELVTEIDCMGLNSGVGNPIVHASTKDSAKQTAKQTVNIACDIQDPKLGIYVSHILAVEIVVAEEALQYTNGQPVKKSGGVHSDQNANSNSLPNLSSTDQRLAEVSPMFANRNTHSRKPIDDEEAAPANAKNNLNNGRLSSSSNSSKIVSVPTGAARVLRMQFRLLVTERSGLGISWDEEVPPIYQDVKSLSPPSYDNSIRHGAMSQNPPAFQEITNPVPNHIAEDKVTIIPFPPMAHHSSISSSTRTLTSVSSPQLETVISLQGNTPIRGNVLTPYNSVDVRVHDYSDVINTDRITQ